ncbi:MAG TPA: hypothetical protein VJ748_04850 [Vitreimonas sp.]|jgi:hypothetical protein|nr:hypothetical protein [Vitreimonas sp.]
MLAILIAVRDFLIAAALAWVGVTMETTRAGNDAPNCAGESCQTDSQR